MEWARVGAETALFAPRGCREGGRDEGEIELDGGAG